METQTEIDLTAEFRGAIGELLEDRKRDIRRKIQQVAGSYRAADGTVRKLREQLTKAEQALEREKQKLTRLEAGDWSVLPEEKASKGEPVNANVQGAGD